MSLCYFLRKGPRYSSEQSLLFDVEEFVGEKEISSHKPTKQVLEDDIKDHLKEIMTHLNKSINVLVENAEPIRSIFLQILNQLPSELAAALILASYIEGHQVQVLEDQRRLADRVLQQDQQDYIDQRDTNR